MCLVSLVLDMRLNILTFKFLTTPGTYGLYAYGLSILLKLPPHLLVYRILIPKGKRVDSSLFTLTICGLTLHS